MANIDKKWFQDRIRDLGTSQRALSQTLAGNPNTLSLILMDDVLELASGKKIKPRKLQIEELPVLANLLDTTTDEIMRRLGLELPHGTRTETVPVVGTIDETGQVTDSATARTVDAPANATAGAKALIFQGLEGGHLQHGWAYYFDEPAGGGKDRPVDADTLDALCVVKVGDSDNYHVGVVRRGIERGRFDLFNAFTGKRLVGGVAIRSARPVTWIKAA